MISEIGISNYRSVSGPARFVIDDDITVLIGANEAGKTNILEAISKFRDPYPLNENALTNTGAYDDNDFENIEILRFVLKQSHIDVNPYLTPPFGYSDIPYLSDQIGENLAANTGFETFLEPLLEFCPPEIIRYASGDHHIDFTCSDAPDELLDQFPMELNQFVERREAELKILGMQFCSNIIDRSEYSFIVNGIDVRESLETVDEIIAGLGEIEIAFDSVVEPISDTEESEESIEYSTNEIAEMAQDLSASLAAINGVDEPTDHLPSIVNQLEIELANSKYDILEDENTAVVQGLKSLGLIRPFQYSSYSSSEFKDDLDLACEELSRFMNAFWNFDYERRDVIDELPSPAEPEFEFDYELDGTEVTLFLEDGSGIKTKLAERSDGVRWIITFLLSIFAQTIANEGSSLVIMDDPGIHLHPEASKKLRRAFYYVVPESQIIYSTHSPALIDNRRPEQLRVVERKEDDGTVITSDLTEARDDARQIDLLSVVRDALGWHFSEYLFTGEYTILVEGPSDKKYLEFFNRFFYVDEDRDSLLEDSSIVVGGGDKITFLSRILQAENVKHVLLLDDDKFEVGHHDDDFQSRSILYRDIPDLGIDVEYDLEIEDLLDNQLLSESVAAEFPDKIDQDQLLASLQSQNRPVKDIIESELTRASEDGEEVGFNEFALAKDICRELEEPMMEGSLEYLDTLDRFEAVFSAIIGHFETED